VLAEREEFVGLGLDSVEEGPVGTERVGEDEGVAPIIFGSGRAVPIAEAVELFGVDGEDLETVGEERLDEGAAGALDGAGDAGGITLGLGMREEPRDELVEGLGGVAEGSVTARLGVGVEKIGVVVLGAAVDTDIQEDGEDGHAKRSFVGERSRCAA